MILKFLSGSPVAGGKEMLEAAKLFYDPKWLFPDRVFGLAIKAQNQTNFPDYNQEGVLTFPHLLWERAERSSSPPSHPSFHQEGGLTASAGTSHTGRSSESHLLLSLSPLCAYRSEQFQREWLKPCLSTSAGWAKEQSQVLVHSYCKIF